MKKILIINIALVLGLLSCTKDFETINSNPNDPTLVDPEFLLRQVIYNVGEEMSYEGFVAGNLLSQHFTMVDFNLFDRHALTDPQLGGNPWSVLYKNLRDVEIILDAVEGNESYAKYEGPAKILKAYLLMALTDIYGDVPVFDAVSGQEGVTAPGYDVQREIYLGENGIKAILTSGAAACENEQGNTALNLDGDILYDGDLGKWLRFANSLLLKMHIRINDAEMQTFEVFDLIIENNFILENEDNASFNFTDLQPNSFRMQQLRDGDFNLFVMSETMEEIMNELNDPRLERFFRPNGTGTEYKGLLNGPDASSTSITVSDYSFAGEIFRENTSQLDANFITAWETEFLLAEAAYKGFVFANPQTHYERGITLAFEYWGVDLPADYLTGAAAFEFGNNEGLEQIITQKWIANIINGYESWIEYRRTGFPALKTVSASLNNDLLPVRMPYPAEEQALNQDNYEAATAGSGNDVNLRVWWDVE